VRLPNREDQTNKGTVGMPQEVGQCRVK
jgi:hypothetical protein